MKIKRNYALLSGALGVLVLAVVLGTTTDYLGMMGRGGGDTDATVETAATTYTITDPVATETGDGDSGREPGGDMASYLNGYPIVADDPSFPAEITSYGDKEIYRFKVTAQDGNISIMALGFDMESDGLDISDVRVIDYDTGTVLGGLQFYNTLYMATGYMNDASSSGIRIMEGNTMTLSVRADIRRNYSDDVELMIRLNNDYHCYGPDIAGTVYHELTKPDVIWAPRVNKGVGDPVWFTAACGVEGFPLTYLSLD